MMNSNVTTATRNDSSFPKILLQYLTLERTASGYLLPVLCAVLMVAGLLSGFRLVASGGPIIGLIVMIVAPCLARIGCEAVSQVFIIARALEDLRLKKL